MSGIIATALLILFGATLIVAFSSRLGVPLELLLLGGSLVLSLVPGLPQIQLQPELVFLLFLPPILFYAAYFTSWRDFKANKRPISLLAIGLVLFTTIAVAAVIKALIPAIPWPVGFILGAMVSPPDASAATAITRKLGVPRRLVTIIEGESLVNDATALVAYRFAIVALATGTFSLGQAALRFCLVGLGGVAIGWIVAAAGYFLIRRLPDTRSQILLSLLTAFGAYSLGEALHVSGVIATVTGGLYFGRCLPIGLGAETQVEGKATWQFVIFVVNAFVFILMGLQLPTVIHNLSGLGYSWRHLIALAAVVSATVIVVRFLWVFPATYLPRWLIPAIRRNDPSPPWTAVVVLSWTGMRGIVSLAAALALPESLPGGEPFPYRNLLIFLTYSVILVTLILPALTLPWLLRRLGIHAGDENRREELKARIASVQLALQGMQTLEKSDLYSAEQVEATRERYKRRLETLQANLADQAFSPLIDEDMQLRRLLRELIRWERESLQSLRRGGEIHDEVFHALANELDLEELHLRTQRL